VLKSKSAKEGFETKMMTEIILLAEKNETRRVWNYVLPQNPQQAPYKATQTIPPLTLTSTTKTAQTN
jgi:hypothetical protein